MLHVPPRRRGARLVAAAAGLIASVATVLTAPTASAAAETFCGQYETRTVASGLYKVQNNLWNPTPGAVQCLRVDGTRFDVTRADSVRPTNGAPASYPSIYKGCHYRNCTAASGLPQRIDSMNQVRTYWSTSQPAVGDYNVSLDVWFAANRDDPDENDGELMVWLNRRGAVQPIGSVRGRTTLGGVEYEVWGSELSRRPQVITYRRVNPTTQINGLDLRVLTRDARNRGFFSESWHLTSVQAGFEMWRGAVGLRTDSFSVATS